MHFEHDERVVVCYHQAILFFCLMDGKIVIIIVHDDCRQTMTIFICRDWFNMESGWFTQQLRVTGQDFYLLWVIQTIILERKTIEGIDVDSLLVDTLSGLIVTILDKLPYRVHKVIGQAVDNDDNINIIGCTRDHRSTGQADVTSSAANDNKMVLVRRHRSAKCF